MSSIELKNATEVFNRFEETLENFHTHAVSIISLSENWQGMEGSFSMAEASMAAREKKVELDKKELTENERRIDDMLTEMKVRHNKMNLREKELDNREKVLESWEMEFDEKSEVLENKEKEIETMFRVLESRERELNKLGEELESRRKEIEEGEIMEKEIEARNVEEVEKRVKRKQKELRELCRVMEVTQAGIVEKLEALKMPLFEEIEKEID